MADKIESKQLSEKIRKEKREKSPKQKPKKIKKKKSNDREQFSRISLTLLPQVALVNAVPQSPQQLNISRSPSPLAHAIASFTKVGHAIIGDTSPTRTEISSSDKSSKENVQKSRGRSEVRKRMMSRPPIPLPFGSVEDIKKEVDSVDVVYAKVHKSSTDEQIDPTFLSYPPDLDKPGENENGYSIVRTHSDLHVNTSTTPSNEKITIRAPIEEVCIEEKVSFQCFREDGKLSDTEKVLPHATEQSGNIESCNEEISEGQLLTLSSKSPEHCSNLQLLYLSNESFGINGQDCELTRETVQEQNTSNSTLEYIFPDQLKRKLQTDHPFSRTSPVKHKFDEMQQISEKSDLENRETSFQPQILNYREKTAKLYAKNNTESVTPFRKNHENKIQTSTTEIHSQNADMSNNVDVSSIDGESQTRQNYLHMSARRSSASNSTQNILMNNKTTNRRTLTPPLEFQAGNDEQQLRIQLHQQLGETLGVLNSLSNTVNTDAQKSFLKHNMHDLLDIASNNEQCLRSGADVVTPHALHDKFGTTNFDPLQQHFPTYAMEGTFLNEFYKSIVKENDALKQAMSEKYKTDLIKHDNQKVMTQLNHVKEQNESLKVLVNRLTAELEEAKSYLKASKKHSFRDTDLSPLVHSYGEQLKEKTQLIKLYEQKLSMLEKNAKLMDKMPEIHDESVSFEEWHQLKEQSRLVLEENQLLVDQKILYKKTIDDLTSQYQHEVSKLAEHSTQHLRDKKSLEFVLSESHLELSQLRLKYDKLMDIIGSHVNVDEHEHEVEKLRRSHDRNSKMLQADINNLQSEFLALRQEKDRLAIQVTDLTAQNSRLTLENDLTKKNFSMLKMFQSLHITPPSVLLKHDSPLKNESFVITEKSFLMDPSVYVWVRGDANVVTPSYQECQTGEGLLVCELDVLDNKKYIIYFPTLSVEEWKCEKRLLRCLHQLETANGKEVTTKETLSKVLKVAENNSYEREKLSRLIESQKEKTNDAMNKSTLDDRRCNQLRQEIREQKNSSNVKLEDMKKQLRNQAKDMEKLKEKYEDELEELKKLVRQKEKINDRIQSNKTSTETQINEMCASLNVNRMS